MLFALKSSKYIIKHAIGALVAPENTPTSPKAAQNANGKPSMCDKVAPSVAPITNKGVTSPPWYPAPKHNAVNISLIINAKMGTFP